MICRAAIRSGVCAIQSARDALKHYSLLVAGQNDDFKLLQNVAPVPSFELTPMDGHIDLTEDRAQAGNLNELEKCEKRPRPGSRWKDSVYEVLEIPHKYVAVHFALFKNAHGFSFSNMKIVFPG